ncbi:6-bladed beta-propeller [Persicitalea sp.]|uniref:6-bladed beta-propeller n=1 Tax=Persicitalea sp. TaxID=3100273 RepID=UPI0035931271
MKQTRREFLATGSTTLIAKAFPFYIIKAKPKLSDEITGHGDFRYRVHQGWGVLDSGKYPVNNCHEMVQTRSRRLFMLTDEPKNNILIYDPSGKLLDHWTLNLKGAHGLTLHDEGGEEFLYITDISSGRVIKSTLSGKIVMELKNPRSEGIYDEFSKFIPTETAVGPNGGIYVADGYGSQFILRYDAKGKFISKFGGDSFLQEAKFKQAHGVAIDYRDKSNPTLICTARMKNAFKRFTLEGKYLETYYLPGAYVSRPVFDGDNLYSGICFGMTPGDYNPKLNRGFVTILDKNNKVVSNPGGNAPVYREGKLDLLLQEQPVFKHCHDVCVDNDKNLYVCQWNAGGVYPYKLERV